MELSILRSNSSRRAETTRRPIHRTSLTALRRLNFCARLAPVSGGASQWRSVMAKCVRNSISQFQMVSQDPYDQLCWAAVALSVGRLYDSASTLELCDVVDKTPGCPAECCSHL